MLAHGENCKHNQDGELIATQREFRLEFECADVAVAVPIHALEYSHCHYTVTIPSVFGCPTECPLAGMSLCNGKGHCAYDTDIQSARCFCDEGYTGDDCTLTMAETESVKQKSGSLTGLIVTLFILIIFRFANHIPLSGIDQDALVKAFSQFDTRNSLMQVINMYSGGGGSLSSMYCRAVRATKFAHTWQKK